jgi:hypothetical protein
MERCMGAADASEVELENSNAVYSFANHDCAPMLLMPCKTTTTTTTAAAHAEHRRVQEA